MPLLATFAGASARGLGFQAGIERGNFESIATGTLLSPGAITFTSIPQNYKHLQIRMIGRSSYTTFAAAQLWFNGDTTSGNYWIHYLLGNGASASAGGNSSNTVNAPQWVGSTQLANTFTSSICDIYDYSNTNKKTTIVTYGGSDLNGSGEVRMYSGFYTLTDAITSITIGSGGASLGTNSTAALYGIKG